MTTPPSFNEVLKLILFGRLSLEIRVGRNWFTLRDEDLEMAGLLLVRPDWKTGRSDRPGLMPVIQHIESHATGFRVDMLESGKQSSLRDAIERVTSTVTARVYLNTLKRVTGRPDTELALPTAKQQKAKDTKPRGEPKPDRHILPEFIEMAIADFRQATDGRRQQVKELRSVFRRLWTSRSASSMEELLDDAENRFRDLSANLSPLMQTLYGRALRAYLKHVGQGCPWTAIGEASKRDGMPRRQQRGLAMVRRFAAELNSALTPADITTSIAEELFALARSSGRNKDIPRLRTGFVYLDALRPLLAGLTV